MTSIQIFQGDESPNESPRMGETQTVQTLDAPHLNPHPNIDKTE